MNTVTIFALVFLKKVEQLLLALGHGTVFFIGVAQGLDAQASRTSLLHSNSLTLTFIGGQTAKLQAGCAYACELIASKAYFKKRLKLVALPLGLDRSYLGAVWSMRLPNCCWRAVVRGSMMVNSNGCKFLSANLKLCSTASRRLSHVIGEEHYLSLKHPLACNAASFSAFQSPEGSNAQFQDLFESLPPGSMIELRQIFRISVPEDRVQDVPATVERSASFYTPEKPERSMALCLKASDVHEEESQAIDWEKILLAALLLGTAIVLVTRVCAPSAAEVQVIAVQPSALEIEQAPKVNEQQEVLTAPR